MTNDEKFKNIWEDKDRQNIMSHVISKFDGMFNADDIIEIKMDAVWGYINSKPHPGKVTTSLYRRTKWECFDRIRKRGTKKVKMLQCVDTLDYFSVDDTQHDQAAFFEEFEHVLTCMDKLDVKERDLIEQHYLCGMTYEEIGLVNKYTKQYAHVCVRKALNKLKRIVGV